MENLKTPDLTPAELAWLEGLSPPQSPKSQTRDSLDAQTEQVFTSRVAPEQKIPQFPAIELSSSPHASNGKASKLQRVARTPYDKPKLFINTNRDSPKGLAPRPSWFFSVLSNTQPFTMGAHKIKQKIRQRAPESPTETSSLTEWVKDLVLEPKGESEQAWTLSESSDKGDKNPTTKLEEAFTIASFDHFDEWPFVEESTKPVTKASEDSENPIEKAPQSEEDIATLSPFNSPRCTQSEPVPPYVRIVTQQALPNSVSFTDAAKKVLDDLQAQTASSETVLKSSYLSTKEIQPK